MEKEAAAIDTLEPRNNVAFKSSMTRWVMLSNCLGCSMVLRLFSRDEEKRKAVIYGVFQATCLHLTKQTDIVIWKTLTILLQKVENWFFLTIFVAKCPSLEKRMRNLLNKSHSTSTAIPKSSCLPYPPPTFPRKRGRFASSPLSHGPYPR